ncbi:MAG TPA: hypothetical protein O0X00_06110 [Methanocorpusculum sp.]|nr:hypothetical protein [Candidatus Methanocorpusculum faecipullorum]HJK18398.1 hypothetical protein [Methanocorpusculum sp.]HJK64543.1 hypothetical protein [Methanocorpusculum sp.]HJK83764.1 hypothetical protein [Methanocorpusculum sp.]
MSERRTLTIGVAINVGNYESLRLEVSDCVQTEEEAAELAAYLNRVLDGYAQNDATTRAAIDRYRSRVLEKYVPEEEPSSSDTLDEIYGTAPVSEDISFSTGPEPSEPVSAPEVLTPVVSEPGPVVVVDTPSVPAPVSAVDVPSVSDPVPSEQEPVAAADTPSVPEPVSFESEPVPAVETPSVPDPTPSESEPAAAAQAPKTSEPVTYTCEKCGAVVSKVQRDVSNLFMGKTLCKACMK